MTPLRGRSTLLIWRTAITRYHCKVIFVLAFNGRESILNGQAETLCSDPGFWESGRLLGRNRQKAVSYFCRINLLESYIKKRAGRGLRNLPLQLSMNLRVFP